MPLVSLTPEPPYPAWDTTPESGAGGRFLVMGFLYFANHGGSSSVPEISPWRCLLTHCMYAYVHICTCTFNMFWYKVISWYSIVTLLHVMEITGFLCQLHHNELSHHIVNHVHFLSLLSFKLLFWCSNKTHFIFKEIYTNNF